MSCDASNFTWEQGLDDNSLEIKVPFVLLQGLSSRDVDVSIGDSDVLIIKVRKTVLWQGRLHAAVEPQSLDWHITNHSVLTIELEKKSQDQWPALLNVPLRKSDPYLLKKSQLTSFLQMEISPLPYNLLTKTSDEELADVTNTQTTDVAQKECTDEVEEDSEIDLIKVPASPTHLRFADEDKNDSAFVSAMNKLLEQIEHSDIPPCPSTPVLFDFSEKITEKQQKVKRVFERLQAKQNKIEKDKKTVETPKENGVDETADGVGNHSEAESNSLIDKDANVSDDAKPVTTGEEPSALSEETKIEKNDTLETEKDNNESADKSVEEKEEEKPLSKDDSDTDLDEILESAVKETLDKSNNSEESVNSSIEAAGDDDMQELAIKMELHGIESEIEGITKTRTEIMGKMAAIEEGSDEWKTLKRNLDITERMLRLGRESSELRSMPATIDRMLKIQLLDIAKARANIGSTHDDEQEEYESENEKLLTGMELFMGAIRCVDSDPSRAVHLWRLAALKKHHGPSAVALFSVYSHIPTSYVRGADILLRDALRDEDMDMRTNSKVAELFSQGMKYFPPLFGLIVYFYQRAAQMGFVNAMVNLYALYAAGRPTGNTGLPFSETAKLLQNQDMARYFLNAGIQRGSVNACLILANLLLQGECGFPKDLDLARKYYQRAVTADSSLKRTPTMRLAGGITIGELKTALYEVEEVAEISAKADALNDSKIAKVETQFQDGANDVQELSFAGLSPQTGSSLEIEDRRSAPVAIARKKATGPVAGGVHQKKFWERAAKVAVGGYAIYCIAFPIRVILLSHFYRFVARCMELVGMAEPGTSSMYVL